MPQGHWILFLFVAFSLFDLFFGATIQNNVYTDDAPIRNDDVLINYDKEYQSVNNCFMSAIEKIQSKTCVTFSNASYASSGEDGTTTIEVHGYDRNECGYQDKTSNTLYLGKSCTDVELCLRLLGKVLTGNKESGSNVFSLLNRQFNCSEKSILDGQSLSYCQNTCENGGSIDPSSCQCNCALGFKGENCSELQYETDPRGDTNCGVISALSEGHLQLKEKVKQNTYCQWVLKSDDPWDTFELEFAMLDLDNEHKMPGDQCGDRLFLSGVKDLNGFLNCTDYSQKQLIGKKLNSEANVVYIMFRAYPYKSDRIGPIIKYRKLVPLTIDGDLEIMTARSELLGTNGIRSFRFQEIFSILAAELFVALALILAR